MQEVECVHWEQIGRGAGQRQASFGDDLELDRLAVYAEERPDAVHVPAHFADQVVIADEDLAERASGDGVPQQSIPDAVRGEKVDVDGLAELVELHHDARTAAEVAVGGREQRPVQALEHPGDESMPRAAERACSRRARRRCV